MQLVPNLPRADVPDGASEHDNVVLRQVGALPEFDFEPRAHWDLGPELGLMLSDMQAGPGQAPDGGATAAGTRGEGESVDGAGIGGGGAGAC